MKIRNGFVSNSSSSSFLLDGFNLSDEYEKDGGFYDTIEDLTEEFNRANGTDFTVLLEGYYLFVGEVLSWIDLEIPETVEANIDNTKINEFKKFLIEKSVNVQDRKIIFSDIYN